MQVSRSSSDEKLARAVSWSFAVHGGIIVFVVLKSLIWPGETIIYTPTLRVDVVGLPDILKKDLMDVSKVLPKEAPKETAPEKAPVKETKPVSADPDPNELLLKPKKKDEKKDEKKEKEKQKAREDKMNSAIARMRALEKVREQSNEDENAAVIIKGNQVSRGTSLSGDAKEGEASYYDLVKDKLIENWALPPWLARQRLSAQVQITVNAAGRITGVKFLKSSGNAQFDDAIRSTLQVSQPLPTPPENLLSTVQNQGILLGFPL